MIFSVLVMPSVASPVNTAPDVKYCKSACTLTVETVASDNADADAVTPVPLLPPLTRFITLGQGNAFPNATPAVCIARVVAGIVVDKGRV